MLISGPELTALVGAWLWPLFRIGAMLLSAPIFGARNVPRQLRLVLALAITVLVVPLLPPQPPVELLSPVTLFIIAQQILIGLVMGFALQIVFSAVITGGQVIAMQMGLGFSLMVDPQNGTQAPVLSQLYLLMVTLVYLTLNGHLVLIQVLVDSFHTMPIGMDGISANSLWQLVNWAGLIFAGGLGMAIPAVASLLVVNLAFGIMTRSAPQLNIFAIGFPLTMLLGFAVVMLSLPSVVPQSTSMFNDTYLLLRQLLGGGA
jgi:flagellar biosynthetic protein FliR